MVSNLAAFFAKPFKGDVAGDLKEVGFWVLDLFF
jgi:hypothetical protein